MKRSSQVFLAVAAFVAAVSLMGCSGLPEFVYAQCQQGLEGPLAEAAQDGLNVVENKCGTTFVAPAQINSCTYEGMRVLNTAKQQTLPQFRDQCTAYVEHTVCKEGSKCYKALDKITPDMSLTAVSSYIQQNSKSLQVRMKATLDSKIQAILTREYDTKYRNRAVPETVQAQCGYELTAQLDKFPDITNDPIMEIYRICTGYGKDSYYTTQCQNEALRRLNNVQKREKDKFKMQCAKAALAKACPPQSPCGIETGSAAMGLTEQEAKNFMWQTFQNWRIGYKNTIMNTARGWTYFGRKFTMFDHIKIPTWQGSTIIAAISIASAVGGIGCVITVVRFARKFSSRTVKPTDAPERVELIEDLEE